MSEQGQSEGVVTQEQQAPPVTVSPPDDESPRARRKRERRERKLARAEEKARRRAERDEQKRRRVAEKLATEDGWPPPPSPTTAPAAGQPSDVSPAEEATGSAAPKAAGGIEAPITPAASPAERLLRAEQREDDAIVMARSEQAEADAERRIREIEQIRTTAESRAVEARSVADSGDRAEPVPESTGGKPLEDELRSADPQVERRHERDRQLLDEIEQTELAIEANKERTEQALVEARRRLELTELEAGAAEKRAVRAERLAELRGQEAERERRLQEMLQRISDAERRARDAEARARNAVSGLSSVPDARAAAADEGSPDPPADPKSAAEPSPAAAVPDSDDGDAEDQVAVADSADTSSQSPAQPVATEDEIDLNDATFEQLRNAGLSVTQTGRVLAHRERSGGFESVDELDEIPGFPREFLDQVKPRLTAQSAAADG